MLRHGARAILRGHAIARRLLSAAAGGGSGGECYGSEEAYLAALASRSALPRGFRVGTTTFSFSPAELANRKAKMTLTLLALDAPTPSFAAMFTTNAFPGAPVLVGRERVRSSPALQAVVINNKISNVCAPNGVAASEALCAGAAAQLALPSPSLVLPCSTGIIGWGLPVPDMVAAIPAAATSLQRDSILPAAVGICTTDLFPKVRCAVLPGGARIVGIAKGAGMVEPGLATMLVYILTDAIISQGDLRAALAAACAPTFNSLSIDSDMSTSDTLLALASNAVPLAGATPAAALADFTAALTRISAQLSEDIVRNGEGVAHVIKVRLRNAPSLPLARAVGKAIVNSPLFKCAVAGNDPNVGRLVAAIGKCVGGMPEGERRGLDMQRVTLTMGGREIFSKGVFALNPDTEAALVKHLKEAQLWGACFCVCSLPVCRRAPLSLPPLPVYLPWLRWAAPSAAHFFARPILLTLTRARTTPRTPCPPESHPCVAAGAVARPTSGSAAATYAAADVSFATPIRYPPHERCVEVSVDFGCAGGVETLILGSDLTHEYVAENADYRS